MNPAIIKTLERAYALQQAGQAEKAEALYDAVLQDDPGNIHALNLLGVLCVNEGRAADAVRYLEQVLQQTPQDPEALANMGLACKDLARFERAEQHLRRSLELAPGQPVVMNNLGNVLRALQKTDQAIEVFRQALQGHPGYAECWSNLAAAYNETEKYEAGLNAAGRALQLEPRLAQAHNNRGDILLAQGDYPAALEAYRTAIDINPRYAAALINMGKTLRDLNLPDEARQTLERVLELEPGNPEAHHALGVLKEQGGDREGAADSFQDAINASPVMGIAYYQLAQIKGRKSSEEELQAMQDALQEPQLRPADKMYLYFGLTRALEQRGRYDEAFDCLARGNRLKSETSPYNDADAESFMRTLVASAEDALARVPLDAGAMDPRPVFVLGMPRSGTSLTEQILASHSQVAGAGELPFASDTAFRSKQLTGTLFPRSMQQLGATQYRELGEYYMGRFRSEFDDHARIVDKTPLNFQYIGLLALALPQARFIHCHRDPVQNCFSIHKLPFDKKQTYAHDLTSLARYYRRYWQLMADWKRLFPGRLLDVRYEDTVSDVEAQSKRMLAFLELPFEPQVLEFHRTERLVKTPSASQVREPIYRDAMQAWRKYERHLQPLIDTLGDLAPGRSGA